MNKLMKREAFIDSVDRVRLIKKGFFSESFAALCVTVN